MAKPAIDQVRFASTTDGNTTYQVEPTAGLKNTGYTTGNKPAAQHHTWLFRGYHKWLAYLDELLGGATGVSETLKAGGLTTAGTVAAATITASANATVGGTLGVTGAATAASIAVTGAATAASVAVTGAATAASVAVTGAATAASVAVTGAATAASVTASGGVTGSDIHNTAFITHNLSPLGGTPSVSPSSWISDSSGNLSITTGVTEWFDRPVPVREGDTVTMSVRAIGPAAELEMSLIRVDLSTGSASTVGTATSGVPPVTGTYPLVSNHVAVAGCAYFVRFNKIATTAGAVVFGIIFLQKR